MVVVTGMGAVCGVGGDVDELLDALRSGRDGHAEQPWLGAGAVASCVAVDRGRACLDLAERAAREAWSRAGAPAGPRVLVVAGTSAAADALERWTDAEERADPEAADRLKHAGRHAALGVAVADALGLAGPRLTVTSACASGTLALAVGMELLRGGIADVVVAGGAEALSPHRYAGFGALGALAPGPCAPFSAPVGMSLGEGAAFLVLERACDAEQRGAPALAALLGHGTSRDGHHATRPEPSGEGIERALREALRDGGAAPADVGVYSAHGTGTEANDAAEWQALLRLCGPSGPALTAAKSMLGHSFGASGALEAVAAVLGLQHQAVAPTLRCGKPRALGPPRSRLSSAWSPHSHTLALSHSAAFGGANASVLIGLEGRPRARQVRPVFLAGGGRVGDEALPARLRGRARGVDPTGRMLAGAAARALEDAGVRLGRRGDRCGLVVGVSRRPWTAGTQFRASVQRAAPSARAFSQTVMNAGAGTVARLLGVRGPGGTVAGGLGAGLLALVLGALWLSGRDDAEQLVVAAADERDPVRSGLDPERPGTPRRAGAADHAAGAVALVLAPRGPVRIAGWGLAGPGRLAEALSATGATPAWIASSAGGPDARAQEAEVAAQLGVPLIASPALELGFGEASTALAAVLGARERAQSGAIGAVVSCDPLVGCAAVALAPGGP